VSVAACRAPAGPGLAVWQNAATMKLRGAALIVLATTAVASAVGATGAAAQLPGTPSPGPPATEPPPPAQNAQLEVHVEGVKKSRVVVGHSVKVVGTITPFVDGQKVEVSLSHGGNAIKDRVVDVKQGKKGAGEFELRSPRLVEPGDYRGGAKYDGTPELGGASADSNPFAIRYPSLHKGDGGHEVAVFNNLLAKQGYATSHGHKYTQITAWGVLAFRKVHGISRIESATSGIFKTLAEGKGAYEVQHPGAGRHAEVNLSKQVLVLANGDRPQLTFHISSGAIATPSDAGGYKVYRKDPGFNSLGMYYSSYYNRGEAIHGYHDVPTHPASHGCIRVPIPQATQIYGWLTVGTPVFVYH
jgi:lipoprotein-anchoring transpeptidase ErfK/SrfK